MNTKEIVLLVVGVATALMGVWAIIAPGYMGVTDPLWHAGIKIVVGIVAIYVAFMKPSPQSK